MSMPGVKYALVRYSRAISAKLITTFLAVLLIVTYLATLESPMAEDEFIFAKKWSMTLAVMWAVCAKRGLSIRAANAPRLSSTTITDVAATQWSSLKSAKADVT